MYQIWVILQELFAKIPILHITQSLQVNYVLPLEYLPVLHSVLLFVWNLIDPETHILQESQKWAHENLCRFCS